MGGGIPIIGGGRIPIMGMCGPSIIGGGGIPGIIWPGRGGGALGGGMATPAFGGACAKGFDAILPALKAAVVASIKCWA